MKLNKLIDYFLIVSLIACISVLLASFIVQFTAFNRLDLRPKPKYIGVEERLAPYVDEYKSLAAKHDIEFTNNVSMGFTEINEGQIIGLCYYRGTFREIDIDREFYDKAESFRKKALVFHELTHCYCTRSHDYDEGKKYPENQILQLIQKKSAVAIPWCLARVVPGFMEDGCANTIMYPEILDEKCLEKHWDHYIKEMFNRCDPW